MLKCPPIEKIHVPENLARALYRRSLAYYPNEAGGLLYGRYSGSTLYLSDYSDTVVRSGPGNVGIRVHSASSSITAGTWHSHPIREEALEYVSGPLLLEQAIPSSLDLKASLEMVEETGCWLIVAVVSVAPPGPGIRYVASFYIVKPGGRVILGAIHSGNG